MNLTDFRAGLRQALDPDVPEPDKTALLNLGAGRYKIGSYGGRGYPRCPVMAALKSDDVGALGGAHVRTVGAIDSLFRDVAVWDPIEGLVLPVTD